MPLGPIPLRVRDEVGVARTSELATGGVPVPAGALERADEARLRGPGGEERRVQATALERWPDGSIRWLSVAFLADVPRQGETVYVLERVDGPGPSAEPVVSVAEAPDGVRVDTGAVSFLVRRAPFDPLCGYPGSSGFSLSVRDAARREYTASGDADVRLRVVADGPVVARIAASGSFFAPEGGRFLDWELELEAVAGSAEVTLDCRIVNREPGESSGVAEWAVRIGGAGAEAASCGVFEQVHRSRSPFRLRQEGGGHTKGIFVVARVESEADDWEDESEPSYRRAWEWAELQGRNGSGWLDIEAVGATRTAIAVPRFADDNPTSLGWDGDGVEIGLWPDGEVLELTQGVALTRRVAIARHSGPGLEASRFAARAASRLQVETGELAFASEAAPAVLPRRPELRPRLESHMRDELFSWCLVTQSTGLVDRGDCFAVPAGPRAGFTANNEHDAVFALCLHYLRSGERAYLESAESYADHVVDVDVIHYSNRNDFELGGMRAHGVNHVHYVPARTDADEVTTSLDTGHMWVEGLLLLTAITGRERYAEAARGIGECLLRLEQIGWTRPQPGPRNAGWPMIALAALYRSTGEARWLEAARRIAAGAAAAQGSDGRWTMRLGFWDGYCAWQNSVLLTGLVRLLEVDPQPDPQLDAAFRAGADALLELGRYDDGGFVYLDRYDYRWVSRTAVIREALAAAYEHTGEERFLLAGLEGGDAWYRPAGAGAASSNDVAEWRGHLRFLAALEQAGLLQDLGANRVPTETY